MPDRARFIPTPVFRERRRARFARIELRDAEGRAIDAMVRDVSRRGISAEANGAVPHTGALVSVVLPDGRTFWGIVRWAADRAFGVEFDTSG